MQCTRNITIKFCPLRVLAFVGLFAVSAMSASAHEFWIEPDASQISVGDDFTATLKVGQDLSGSTYSYLPPRFVRFTITVDGRTMPVKGRAGDNPALQMNAQEPGLQIVAYHSEFQSLTYASAEKFQQFLNYEGLDWVLDEHQKRGLPAENFRERYTRFAKSLVQVGPYSGSARNMDQSVGLPIELVAMQSPYEPGREWIDVKLLRSGTALEGIQVATFQRNADGTVVRRLTRSNRQGVAKIQIDNGGFFLVSAVQMEAVEPLQKGEAANSRMPVWHSLWASLSFRLDAD